LSGRCSLNGHTIYFDELDDSWKYTDTKEKINVEQERPCITCGHIPTEQGHDYCIANLGKVINACCGHGKEKGYIQFDNGLIIRGYFEIDREDVK
jgi:hypothetical protein